MQPWVDAVDSVAAKTSFSGVVRIDASDGTELAKAYGMAHRGLELACMVDTQFATASAAKGLTALAVMSLVEAGTLNLATSARSVLGTDLPLIRDDVTIEHLLAHRSGIGDYLDESSDHEITDYVMTVPVHELATTEDFVPVVDGFPTVAPPGEKFAYCNGGFIVLALIAERASGVPFHDLVVERVCGPAGMVDTAFLRSDELPGRAALGYLEADAPRTNVFHLPVRGNGDGGVYSTAADIKALWDALFAGRIVSSDLVAEMVRPRSDVPEEQRRYGLGFWLHEKNDVVMLEGYDAGVSFLSMHDPGPATTYTVIANTSEGAWPIAELSTTGLTGHRASSRTPNVAMFLVVLRRSGPQWDPSRALEQQSGWDEHAAFMDDLVDQGFIILGGPLSDELRVAHAVEAESEDMVRTTLARDPWSQTHLVVDSIDPWTIRLDGCRSSLD